MHLCIVLSLMLSEQQLNGVVMMWVIKSIESLGPQAWRRRGKKEECRGRPRGRATYWMQEGQGRNWVTVLHEAGVGRGRRLEEDSNQEVSGALGKHTGDGQSQHIRG